MRKIGLEEKNLSIEFDLTLEKLAEIELGQMQMADVAGFALRPLSLSEPVAQG